MADGEQFIMYAPRGVPFGPELGRRVTVRASDGYAADPTLELPVAATNEFSGW